MQSKEQRRLFQHARTTYWSSVISDSLDNKTLWRRLNSLLQPNESMLNPLSANSMASYFDNKVALIRASTDGAPSPNIEVRKVTPFNDIGTFTDDEVRRFIMKAPSKHCSLDPVPSSIVKQCSDILAPAIAAIANQSFKCGEFPDSCKHAIVKPLLKKSNLDPFEPKSYRPISNLTFLSKLIERLVMDRLNNHIAANRLLPTYQSAYRQHHSTETAVTIIVNDIRRALDKGDVCALVLLDMSAAFDTVDHAILIDVLEKRFGVQGTALQWMTSYLSRRTQSVHIGSECSIESLLTCGVPQGSVLGPSKYSMYTEEIDGVIQSERLRYHMYADDTQLLATMPPTPVAVAQNKAVVERCVTRIRNFCSSRRLTLQPEKTETMWFGTSAGLSRIMAQTTMKLGTSDVVPSDSVRDLGVWLDSKLDMHIHISRTVSTGFFHLRRIRQLRRILPRALKQRLVSALILSRIDYCNAVLAGLPASSLTPLQRLMNAAVRFVADLKPRAHVTPAFRELHWLPVEQRITFKLCTIMHGVVHGRAPAYLSDTLSAVSSFPARRHLRSAAAGLFDVPRIKTVHGGRAFSVAGPTAWNNLPHTVRNIDSAVTFRRHLKGHLFDDVYG